MKTIQSHRYRLSALLIGSALITGCPGKPPAAEAPAAPPVTTETQASESADEKPATKRAPRPVRAPAPTDKLHLVRTSGSVRGPIPYVIIAPVDAPPEAPIVLALHGRGDSSAGFSRLVERLRLPMRFIVGDAPMPWGLSGGRRWFDMTSDALRTQLSARVNDLVTLADQVAARWPKAPAPILLGFSQGAMLALQATAERSDRFAGTIALSGSLLAPEGHTKAAAARPVLLTAGKTDRIVTPERSREAAKVIEGLGHNVEVLEFPGGHAVPRVVVTRIREVLKDWTATGRQAPGSTTNR